jgi:hypothetical protein
MYTVSQTRDWAHLMNKKYTTAKLEWLILAACPVISRWKSVNIFTCDKSSQHKTKFSINKPHNKLT